jgi:hypothetical protein
MEAGEEAGGGETKRGRTSLLPVVVLGAALLVGLAAAVYAAR